MAIQIGATRQNMADHYGTIGSWVGAATAAPGTTTTPSNEVTGGSPAYARKQTVWSSGSNGQINGTKVSIDIPAGVTVTHIILASAATTGAANQVDNADVTDIAFSQQGILDVTPQYNQT